MKPTRQHLRAYRNVVFVVLLLPGLLIAGQAYDPLQGKLNYTLQCQGCHRATGEGIVGSVPDLRYVGAPLLRMQEGRRFFVAVPGSANAPLTDRQLADVLNYIISEILVVSDDAQPMYFSEAEVTKFRAYKIADVASLREELVARVEGGAGEAD